MDPLATVDYLKDTTFAFMLGAKARGHSVFHLAKDGISLHGDRAAFEVQPVVPHDNPEHLFDTEPRTTMMDSDVGAIFIRNNPPFDQQYLMNTWLLQPVAERIAVINDPAGIRGANEKLWAMNFPDLMPETCVTRSREEFIAFLASHESIVVKPTDGFGGSGVFVVNRSDGNASVIFETLSANASQHVVLQALVPEASQGDKRILLLNGDILGAVLRVQDGDDHRNNFFAGGKPHPTEITEKDKAVVERLKPHLIEQGLHFVGIDMLGESLIEVNVTSPTCLQEINRITGEHLEDRVIAFAEELAESKS
jgi:glutathione synthase